MSLVYEVPEYKKLRVIIDTDAACEADDPFAIAHALMSRKLVVKAILAEQFGAPDTTRLSYNEIMTVLDAMDMDVPVFMGEEGKLSDVEGQQISPAARYLIEEAMKEDPKPSFVLCQGAITNIASAIKECPQIVKRLPIW